ncbi:MAG: hypothetical protein ACREAU_04400, partial [Nitrosopumilaceae archaeon]
MNNNVSLGRIPCFLREEFCHNQKPIDKRIPGIIFGVESIPGCAFGFHVHREDGAVYCQIPIHGLCWKQDAPLRELSELQVWDCFGWNISVCKFDYLTQLGGIVRVGGQTLPCQYITTIDPYDDDYSSDPIQ